MMKNTVFKCSLGLAIFVSAFGANPGLGQTHNTCPAPGISISTNIPVAEVTKKNYAKAETSDILIDYVKKIAKGTCSSGVGVFMHNKQAMDPADRTILRANFDTLYSFVVLDLSSPTTIVLPEIDRFQILEVVSDQHWIPLVSDRPGSYNLSREFVGSRYAFAIVRTQVNMQDAEVPVILTL